MRCMRQYCPVSSTLTLDTRFLRFMISYISQSAYRARDNRKFCQRIPRRAHHRSISCASSVGRIPSEYFVPTSLSFFHRRQGYGNDLRSLYPQSTPILLKERDGERRGGKGDESERAERDGWPASNSVFIPRSDAPGPFLINSN